MWKLEFCQDCLQGCHILSSVQTCLPGVERCHSNLPEVMSFSAKIIIKKTYSVVTRPVWYAACDRGMYFLFFNIKDL